MVLVQIIIFRIKNENFTSKIYYKFRQRNFEQKKWMNNRDFLFALTKDFVCFVWIGQLPL